MNIMPDLQNGVKENTASDPGGDTTAQCADSADTASHTAAEPSAGEAGAPEDPLSAPRKKGRDLSRRSQYIMLMCALALLTAVVCAAALLLIRLLTGA